MDTLFEDKKLYLLDGMALIYRAHFALIRSPRYTSGGVCTSAVFGFTNTLLEILEREKPTHLGVAFDTAEPTPRHIEYPEYKAQRDAMPEDLSEQIPLVFRLVEAFRIPVIRIPGYEADDIIGTLARQAEDAKFTTYMVTPDKDYHQLVSDNIFVHKPGRQGNPAEILGVPQVLDKWQVEQVDQVIDILGLMGDSSDNIPGVPGVGEKTAQKLIAKFGSVENLLANTNQLKGKQKEKVEDNAEMARLSKKLVTIITDVPHDVTFDSLAIQKRDDELLKPLLVELEMETIGKRLFGRTFSVASARNNTARKKRESEIQMELFSDTVDENKTIQDVEHNYRIIRTKEERAELIEKLKKQSAFCFDTETTGLDPREALPLGVAFAFTPHEAYYVVCDNGSQEAATVLEEFRELFEDPDIEKIGHNLKYDISLLKWHGFDVRGKLMDTMLAHSMKEPEMKHGLDYLSKLYLGYEPIPTSALIGERGTEQLNMRDVPIEKVGEYACEDVDVTLQVCEVIKPDIKKREVDQVCHEVECPLIPVLVDMEFEGIRLDSDALHRYSQELHNEIVELQSKIFQSAGREFNIDSPKQLGIVLYDELKLEEKPKKTATGQYSTKESELQRLASKHQIIQDVLDYRSAVKLKSVYVDQLPSYADDDGRLHTHYGQAWTATGRMQSNNPNLQTIPVRKERGREIRAAFIARDENYSILAADYSQIELRIMAELCNDESMLEAFRSGTDIHAVTASKVYKVELDDVTREMRDKAKTVNFGIIYGISAFGLQQRLNIPRQEAKEVIENYFEKYPGVQEYIDRTIAFAKEHGYVKTLTGRRRYLRDISSRNFSLRSAAERLAMNSPIQGTAADMLKLAMIKVHRLLREGDYKTRMLLTVHDEIVFDLYNSERDELLPKIEQAMKTALPMDVPIVVEMGVGANWLEAH